jgi:hypothetical protein
LEVSGKSNGQSKNGASGYILKPDIFALVKTGHFNFGLTGGYCPVSSQSDNVLFRQS